jgi:hypothetical protein
MNAPSSELDASAKLRYYEENLDELEAGSQVLARDSLTYVALFAVYFLSEAAHLLSNFEPLLSVQILDKPGFLLAGATVALIAAGYIGVSFLRQRRDVIRNEIGDLRLRISHLAALEQVRTADGSTTDAGR